MRWIRSNRRFGGCLALLALALQLAISFAHVHPEDFGSSISVSQVSGRRSSGLQLSAEAVSPLKTPASHQGNGLPHDDCAICISIFLTSNALIGAPPVLFVPPAFDSGVLAPIGEFDLAFGRYFSFQTRAPPAV